MKIKRGFASDNNAGVHPDIMNAIVKANSNHTIAYGDDDYTHNAEKKLKRLFSSDPEVYFVLTGTGANILGLQTMGHSFNSVLCAHTAHINVDECGAPEKFTGMKVIPIVTDNGKLSVELVTPYLHGFNFQHHSQPMVISITQPTEVGTLYTVNEIKMLAELAHQYNMFLHVDGARIANATVALDCPVADFTEKAGVDVLSFGGTKNGMMYGEAVIFFNKELAVNFKYYRKQSSQLASKMRFVGAQFSAFLENDLWLKNARQANKMAALLAENVQGINGVSITQKVEANGVFAIIPRKITSRLQDEYFFYIWDDLTNEVRWMCSFDTTVDDVLGFSDLLKKLLNKA